MLFFILLAAARKIARLPEKNCFARLWGTAANTPMACIKLQGGGMCPSDPCLATPLDVAYCYRMSGVWGVRRILVRGVNAPFTA